MKLLKSDQTLIKIPGGLTACEYAFFPGPELCAFFPEQVIFSYEAAVQQKQDTAIFIADISDNRLREYWQSIGSPAVIFASSSDMHKFKEAVPEANVVSLYEKFAEWNIFGSCVHDSYHMSGKDKNTGKAVKALLETMGASVKDITDGTLPVLTYDVCERNALLSEGKDAYFALELFFGTEAEDELEHNHENHSQKQLRSPDECRAAIASEAEQQQNISDVCETVLNLFF